MEFCLLTHTSVWRLKDTHIKVLCLEGGIEAMELGDRRKQAYLWMNVWRVIFSLEKTCRTSLTLQSWSRGFFSPVPCKSKFKLARILTLVLSLFYFHFVISLDLLNPIFIKVRKSDKGNKMLIYPSPFLPPQKHEDIDPHEIFWALLWQDQTVKTSTLWKCWSLRT